MNEPAATSNPNPNPSSLKTSQPEQPKKWRLGVGKKLGLMLLDLPSLPPDPSPEADFRPQLPFILRICSSSGSGSSWRRRFSRRVSPSVAVFCILGSPVRLVVRLVWVLLLGCVRAHRRRRRPARRPAILVVLLLLGLRRGICWRLGDLLARHRPLK